MGRYIKNYERDKKPEFSDKVIGTDSETGKTYNYSLWDIYQLFNKGDLSSKPVIMLLGSSSVSQYQEQIYNDEGVVAMDANDGDITSQVVVNNPVDINTPGTYTITYNVANSTGVDAEEVTRTVNILAKTLLAPPLNIVVSNVDKTTADVTFSPVTGATSYLIYLNGSNFTTTTSPSITLTGLSRGTDYNLQIMSVGNPVSTYPSSLSTPAVPFTTGDFMPYYHGNNTTGNTPTESEILAENGIREDISIQVVFNPNASMITYFWLAVPKVEASIYTKWIDSGDTNNWGTIDDPIGWVKTAGEVNVNGDIYTIYKSSYISEFTRNLIIRI